MILTGKALEGFEKFIWNNYNDCTLWTDFYNRIHVADVIKELPETLLMSLIIEWFDTVDLIIIIALWDAQTFEAIIQYDSEAHIPTSIHLNRSAVTKEAIIFANDLYNLNNK